MVGFWDKIKSVAKDTEEKKPSSADAVEEKKEASKKDDSKVADVKKEKTDVKTKKEDKKESKKLKKDKKKKVKKIDMKAHEARLANKVLIRPKISEAVMNQQVLGKYVFEVSKQATKSEIARAVGSMYGVTVVKVNTLCYKPKTHGFRGRSGVKSGFKKAIVSLKQGESIEMFKESK